MPKELSADALAFAVLIKELATQPPHQLILLVRSDSYQFERGEFYESFDDEWDCWRVARSIQELEEADVLRSNSRMYLDGFERLRIWFIGDSVPVSSPPPRCGSECGMSQKTSQTLCEPSRALLRYLESIYPIRLQLATGHGVQVDGQFLRDFVTEKMGCECPPDDELWPWFRGLITKLEDAGYAKLEDVDHSNRILGYLLATGASHAEQPDAPDEHGGVASSSWPRSEAELIATGNESGNLVKPEKTEAPTYTVAALREMTGLKNAALHRYAKKANVKTPQQGQKNFRYTTADVRAILETIIANSTEDALRAKCNDALRDLPEITK